MPDLLLESPIELSTQTPSHFHGPGPYAAPAARISELLERR